MIILDWSNLCHIALYAGLNPLDTSFQEWKSKFLVMSMNIRQRFQGEKFCWCLDSHHSWRHDAYTEYKANRVAAREQSVIDFKAFFPIKDKFIDQLREAFDHDYWLKVPRAEADDIIAIIARTIPGEHTIISTDRDFIQLLQYDNVKLWNPVKKTYRESIDPKMELLVKIITGDPGDNVPQLLPKVGEKRALKIIETLDKVLLDPVINEAFERNKKLIDFMHIPSEIENAITEAYNQTKLNQFSKKKFSALIMSIDLSLLGKAETWSELMEEQ